MDEKEKAAGGYSWQKHKKLYLWALSGFVIVAVVAYFTINAYLTAPRDLGPDLVYVGKQDYGCLYICDSAPSANYYFATSMSQVQLISYMSKAGYEYDPAHSDSTDGDTGLVFPLKNGSGGLDINYFVSVQDVLNIDRINLGKVNQPHIVKIADYAYQSLRQSLQQAGLLK